MTTWILLRGLTRGSGHWGQFPDLLRAHLPIGDQILTPDLPGNGAACHLRSASRVSDMVAQLRQATGIGAASTPVRLIAMSLGAMIATEWAYTHPEEIQACVLINTSMRPFSPFWHRLRPQNYGRIASLLMRRASADEWEQAILEMTSRHPAAPFSTRQAWCQLRAHQPVQTSNALRQLWAAAKYRAPNAPPRVPMLILNGQGDRLVHPSCSAQVAKAWQTPILTHPTAGHDLPLDAGPWVAQQIAAWAQHLPSPALRPAHPADPESADSIRRS